MLAALDSFRGKLKSSAFGGSTGANVDDDEVVKNNDGKEGEKSVLPGYEGSWY